MHIPDGYLSPSTCAVLYGASVPWWWLALRRARQLLATRAIPLLAVVSAFSFVIMMFNLPLPGGTTGHAVGMGIASIVLGPWISLLAISTALLIQALLFGDGGVTTYGANCFNMAILGSLAAYLVYRAVAFNAGLFSARRVMAAGLAGYCAINLAALCAAIEFGLQPLLFHAADGTPLYAPYPLRIAVPAMLLGHLTIAGVAEFVISAGLVGYLQRADPGLLRGTAPDAPDHDAVAPATPVKSLLPWRFSPKLWALVGVLLVLTPLGILATGNAWGEWRPADFAKPPLGMERLSQLWLAPLAGYAPGFVRNPKLGYLVAATMGVGAIILLATLAAVVGRRVGGGRSRVRKTFVEKTIGSLLRASEEALFAETIAARGGFLQQMNPRVKLAGWAALLLVAITVARLEWLALLFVAAAGMALGSRIPLRNMAGRVWLGVMLFTGVIALPEVFLAAHAGQGMRAAAFLVLRAETAATLTMSLLVTTRWNQLLRALRLFLVPAGVIVMVQMTYRYLFVCLQAANEFLEARRVRLLGPVDPLEARGSAAAIAGALLDRSLALSGDVHAAMLARGFRGEIRLLDERTMSRADWVQVGLLCAATATALWLGR